MGLDFKRKSENSYWEITYLGLKYGQGLEDPSHVGHTPPKMSRSTLRG